MTVVLVAVAVCSLAADCGETPAEGLLCKFTPNSSSGGCSGSPVGGVCPGSKTLIQYAGCSGCVAGGQEGEYCQTFNCPKICGKRNVIVPCVVANGRCVEGPANPPGGWFDTNERFC